MNLNKLGTKKADQSLPPINCAKATVHDAASRRTPDRREASKGSLLVVEKEVVPNRSEIERRHKRMLELNRNFGILTSVHLSHT